MFQKILLDLKKGGKMEFFGLCKGLLESGFPNVTVAEMYEQRFSRFYNSFVSINEDLSFFQNLTKVYGRKVLDLGCGTGRVSIPLAQDGCDVTAVDLSADMLSILAEKAEGKEYKLKIIQEDVCNLCLEEEFDIAILPVGTIVLIWDKEKLFESVYHNLRLGGVFTFSYFDYGRINDNRTLMPHMFFNKQEKSFCIMTEKIDIKKGIANMNIFIEDVLPSGEAKHYITSTENSIIKKEEIQMLTDKFRFKEIDAKLLNLGDYDMIFETLMKI